MEVNTSFAEDIHATDQNAQYDAACKKLLSQKIILAWIMKSCLDEYRNCDVKVIAEKYIEGTPRWVRCRWRRTKPTPRGSEASAARTPP